MVSINNLKELRKKFGLTQIEMAKKVGVSMLTWRLWEMGAASPKKENVKKLEKAIKELQKEKAEKNEKEGGKQNAKNN